MAALFTKKIIWKQPKCPVTGECFYKSRNSLLTPWESIKRIWSLLLPRYLCCPDTHSLLFSPTYFKAQLAMVFAQQKQHHEPETRARPSHQQNFSVL